MANVTNTSSSQEKAATLRALHMPGNPLVLPNAWDAASARMVEAAGFPVAATSSNAMAAVLGYEDGEQAPFEEVLAYVARIRYFAGARRLLLGARSEGYWAGSRSTLQGLCNTGGSHRSQGR